MISEARLRERLALRLHAKTKSMYIAYCDIPTISFEELGVAFQAPIAMDLRNAGICSLSSTSRESLPGLIMRKHYIEMSTLEFRKELKILNLI